MKYKRDDKVFLINASGYTGYATVMGCFFNDSLYIVIRDDGGGWAYKYYDEKYGLSDKKYWEVASKNIIKIPSLITKILYTLKDFITRITRRK
jgi:hypothetical protein